MKNCPRCDHVYMYEIVDRRRTWEGSHVVESLRCMFCDLIQVTNRKYKQSDGKDLLPTNYHNKNIPVDEIKWLTPQVKAKLKSMSVNQ
jgi:hypothetical protein